MVYTLRDGKTDVWALISLTTSFASLGMGLGKVCCRLVHPWCVHERKRDRKGKGRGLGAAGGGIPYPLASSGTASQRAQHCNILLYVTCTNDLLTNVISNPTNTDYQPYLSKQRRKIRELEGLVGSGGAELGPIDQDYAVSRILSGTWLMRNAFLHFLAAHTFQHL